MNKLLHFILLLISTTYAKQERTCSASYTLRYNEHSLPENFNILTEQINTYLEVRDRAIFEIDLQGVHGENYRTVGEHKGILNVNHLTEFTSSCITVNLIVEPSTGCVPLTTITGTQREIDTDFESIQKVFKKHIHKKLKRTFEFGIDYHSMEKYDNAGTHVIRAEATHKLPDNEIVHTCYDLTLVVLPGAHIDHCEQLNCHSTADCVNYLRYARCVCKNKEHTYNERTGCFFDENHIRHRHHRHEHSSEH